MRFNFKSFYMSGRIDSQKYKKGKLFTLILIAEIDYAVISNSNTAIDANVLIRDYGEGRTVVHNSKVSPQLHRDNASR